MINEFATAAFRFGHTLLNGRFDRADPISGNLLNAYLLRFNFEIDTLYKENPDFGMRSILKGMTLQSAQSFDNFITEDVTNFLFARPANNFLFGEDLIARNIQRGRDHSIQGWAAYRESCGLASPRNWNDKPAEISLTKWSTLKRLYVSINDIDLFTGSLAENPVAGGTVGPTFACIIGNQFSRLARGDRFFFTHSGNVGSKFTTSQIQELRRVTMFDLLCKNFAIPYVQRRPFENLSITADNPLVECWNSFSININSFV
jgi:peroxidase